LFWTELRSPIFREIHFPFLSKAQQGETQLHADEVGISNPLRIVTLDNRNDEHLLLIMALQLFSGSH
jgi:hypothetical protein